MPYFPSPISPSSQDSRPKHPYNSLPTCRELGERLLAFGDIPLFSGSTNFAISDFIFRHDGLLCTKARLVDEATIPSNLHLRKEPRHG